MICLREHLERCKLERFSTRYVNDCARSASTSGKTIIRTQETWRFLDLGLDHDFTASPQAADVLIISRAFTALYFFLTNLRRSPFELNPFRRHKTRKNVARGHRRLGKESNTWYEKHIAFHRHVVMLIVTYRPYYNRKLLR